MSDSAADKSKDGRAEPSSGHKDRVVKRNDLPMGAPPATALLEAARNSLLLNKLLGSLHYLHSQDFDMDHMTEERLERIAFLRDESLRYRRSQGKHRKDDEHQQVYATIFQIALEAQIEDAKDGVLMVERLKEDREKYTWERDEQDRIPPKRRECIQLMSDIGKRVATWQNYGIPFSPLAVDKCNFCTNVTLRALKDGVVCCTQHLPFPFRNTSTNAKMAPEMLCQFGIFLYKNLRFVPDGTKHTPKMITGTFDKLMRMPEDFKTGDPQALYISVHKMLPKLVASRIGLRPYVVPSNLRLAALPGVTAAAADDGGRTKLDNLTVKALLSTGAPETVAMVKCWLKECDENHPACSKALVVGSVSGKEPVLPTRVIDVGPPQSSANPRLILSKGRRARYCALSHCWGGAAILSTRRNNLAAMEAGISLDNFPATFVDAIKITRRLGIRYVWIDSLCIIQDDEEDWKSEAQKMGSVYQSAYLTIAASASPDASAHYIEPPRNEKLFKIRYGSEPKSPPPLSINGLFSRFIDAILLAYLPVFLSRFLLEVVARSLPQFVPLLTQDPKGDQCVITTQEPAKPEQDIEQAPLNHRGWVLQERLLSRRTLHFTRSQVYWECRQHAIAQDGTIFNPKSRFQFQFPLPGLIREMHTLRDAISDKTARRREFQTLWLSIAEFYTRCALTFDKDRLIALLGLVDKFSAFTTMTYVGGNWFLEDSDEIPVSLLWTSTKDARRPCPLRTASWSWASVEGEVDMTFHNRQYVIDAKLLKIEWPGRERKFPALRIRGQLLDVSVDLGADARQKARPISTAESGVIGNVNFDVKEEICQQLTCLFLMEDNAGYPIFLALVKTEEKHEKDGTAVYKRVGMGSMKRGYKKFGGRRMIVLV
ncbi:heterokaryon incompatibility protein-domain-containing protein [Stachybotrys elegans]|uniref:Heterokaryon incompatibility protein-domain-containing protein n=1 Tax=Stachybotrys elegans TaxID=80388 RepID=A0A8K0SX70_9HYPO|nr:heterokaryon incompatibility protein-domain-containing protein [Stachybotrys elegans]